MSVRRAVLRSSRFLLEEERYMLGPCDSCGHETSLLVDLVSFVVFAAFFFGLGAWLF